MCEFDNVVFRPKPASKPHPPIWVGGESAPALRRAAEIGDGWYPVSNNARILLNTPALLKAGIERLHRAAEKVGRDPASIDIAYVWFMPPRWTAKMDDEGRRRPFTGSGDDMLEDAAAFAAVGVKHLIVYTQQPTIGATLDVQQRFAEDVVRKSMTDQTWLESAPLPDLMAQAAREARRGVRAHRLLLAESVHSADEAVPGRLPLLHVRRTAARRPCRRICRPMRCWRSRAPGRPPAAPRRCSRSGISRNCDIARRGRHWLSSGMRRRSATCGRCARWC